jgi:serpin B
MPTSWVLVAAIVVVASGCDSDADTTTARRTVDPASEAIRAAVASNASVALKLHSRLREQPGNLFYSPLSIQAVLGMLYAAADGETAAQIGAVLDVAGDAHVLHEGLGALLSDLAGERSDRGYTLSLANRLFAEEQLDPSDEFVEITSQLYDAPMEKVDYRDPEAVRARINRWVDAQTSGKIPELLREGQISALTILTVVNAIYFRADWLKGFDPDLTKLAAFHRADGSDVSVPMMTLSQVKIRTAVMQDSVLVELPYRGGDISFLAYAPFSFGNEKNRDVTEIEAELDGSKLEDLVALLEDQEETAIKLPRFSLHSRLDMIPTLKALGIVDLFDAGRADLSKLGERDSYVDPFVHEATLKVDEAGTEAAAATAAAVKRKSAAAPIELNRPFVFFIRDNLTGAILFTGRVADPSAE